MEHNAGFLLSAHSQHLGHDKHPFYFDISAFDVEPTAMGGFDAEKLDWKFEDTFTPPGAEAVEGFIPPAAAVEGLMPFGDKKKRPTLNILTNKIGFSTYNEFFKKLFVENSSDLNPDPIKKTLSVSEYNTLIKSLGLFDET